MTLFEQSWLSGMVKNTVYNGLLHVALTETELLLSYVVVNIPIVQIPLQKIDTVASGRTFFVPELEVTYFDTTGHVQSFIFRTWKYRTWIEAFQRCDIQVVAKDKQR